jgi:sugar lactone lactonase YvrE
MKLVAMTIILGLTCAGDRASAEPGARHPIGSPGAYRDALAAVGLGGKVYVIARGGALLEVDAATGKVRAVGATSLAGARFLFTDETSLYTIDPAGTLRQVSPKDGRATPVGAPGAHRQVIAAVGLAGRIYTVDKGGALRVTDPATGRTRAVGKPSFASTRFLAAAGGKLFTINGEGTLLAVSATNGLFTQVGLTGVWSSTLAAVAVAGQICTVEKGGTLYATDPATGKYRTLGRGGFAATRLLLAVSSGLVIMETSGSLFRVALE